MSAVWLRVLGTYVVILVFLLSPKTVSVVQRIAFLFAPPQLSSTKITQNTTVALQLIFWPSDQVGEYTAAEVSHLVDVRNLMRVLALGGGVALLALVILTRGKTFPNRARDLKRTAWVITALTILTALGFPIFFELFHRILFPQGNYAFPPDSNLIQTFPPVFWLLEFIFLQTGVVVAFLLQARHAERPKL